MLSFSALFLLSLAGCPPGNSNEREADAARALDPASERNLEYQPNASVTDPVEPARGMPE
jgi:hypothetical protein